jgi:hypothetical protein
MYRAMTDDELLEHVAALWLCWRFGDDLEAAFERHWNLAWFELEHRGLTFVSDGSEPY